MIVAHRGASKDAPENTMQAFMLAWEQKADAIEADFQLTIDGHIVCIHDKNTKRVTGVDLVVSESTLDELRKLDVGSYHGQIFENSRTPTLSEVFSIVPEQKKIYIEIKCGVEIIPLLLREIDKSGLTEEQVVIICFDAEVIKEFKALAPQHKAYWLCHFNVQETGETTPSLETVMNTLKMINADGIDTNAAIPESFIRSIIKQGYEWHVWTIDEPQEAKQMSGLGVVSITTNRPGYIRKHLSKQSSIKP